MLRLFATLVTLAVAAPSVAGTLDIPVPDRFASFDGRADIRYLDPTEIPLACNRLFKRFNVPARLGFYGYGCAATDPATGICHVRVIRHRMEGYTPSMVLRHELGHCAGWPSDHSD